MTKIVVNLIFTKVRTRLCVCQSRTRSGRNDLRCNWIWYNSSYIKRRRKSETPLLAPSMVTHALTIGWLVGPPQKNCKIEVISNYYLTMWNFQVSSSRKRSSFYENAFICRFQKTKTRRQNDSIGSSADMWLLTFHHWLPRLL